MAGKYDALTEHLKANKRSEIVMTFAQIEQVIGSPLPPFAHETRFWANTASLAILSAKPLRRQITSRF